MRDEGAPPAPELDEAVRLLASLRRVDPRLVLGARDVGRLAPTVAAWLAAGVHPDDVVVIVSGGLPQGEIWHPAGFVARRLGGGMPPPLTAVPVAGHDGAAALREAPAPRRPLPFVNCTCCDRAIRGHRDTLCPECAATGCRPTGGTGSRTSCPNRPKPAVGTEPRPRRWGWQPPRWS